MITQKTRVGCIGAGVLGGAIIRRLVDLDFAPVVWNRDRTRLVPLVKAGATEADSPEELTRSTTFIVTCVSDGAAVEKELARLLPLKTKAEYEPDDIPRAEAARALERARRCVAVARRLALE